jgi:glycosyltransferase involved in cell wall biosynthesis
MPPIPSTPKLVLVAPTISDGFMTDDMRIMHRFAEVIPMDLGAGGRRGFVGRGVRLARTLALFTYRIVRYRVGAVVFWFASTNVTPLLALVAKGLGTRVVVITGGKDAVYVPELDWGDMGRPWHRRMYGALMRLADVVLPFSDSARDALSANFRPRRMYTLYPAVDTRFFAPRGERSARPRVVTCCYEYTAGNIRQKGLDVFVAAARLLPDVDFLLVGTPADEEARRFAGDVPPNVTIIPRLASRGRYRDVLASSHVYAQFSAHEGFGVSVAEAMATGAIPVVSDRFALPEVVGDAGLVVAYGDVAAAATAIRTAVCAPTPARARARARVAERFAHAERAARLRAELERLVPALARQPLRIELGCGSTGVAGAIGVDARRTVQTSAVCDVQQSCFATGIADEVYSFCVLEHLHDPYKLMHEVVRILKPGGRAYLRVPNLGTFSSHLDTTHRFLADLKIWRGIMEAYFERVTVVPEGTKYRDNPLLTAINWTLVRVFRFHELTQGWTFVCDRPRAVPGRAYTGWWQESEVDA